MGRRRSGRPLNGVVLIDKAPGMTSNDVVQKAKRLFFAAKAGHTGALDPLATGVLPICFGESTKFSQYLLDADKVYESVFHFGMATDTADSDGSCVSENDASGLSAAALERAMSAYRGDILQVPPMYSALKKDGQPLYKLARAGIEIEREARPVTVRAFELLSFEPGIMAKARVRIACTKGTYVRSLAADIGEDLGLGGHVACLRRLETGAFSVTKAISLEALIGERGEGPAEVLDHHLLPVDAPVHALPLLELDVDSAFYFCRGQAVMHSQVYRIAEEGATVRVFRPTGEFLGLAEVTDDGRVTPRRLVAS